MNTNTPTIESGATSRRSFLSALSAGAVTAIASVAASESATAGSPNPELIALGEALKAAKAGHGVASLALRQRRAALRLFKATDPMPEPYYCEHLSTCTETNKLAFDDECREWQARVFSAIGPGDGLRTAATAAHEACTEAAVGVAYWEAAILADLIHKADLVSYQPNDCDEISPSIVDDLLMLRSVAMNGGVA